MIDPQCPTCLTTPYQEVRNMLSTVYYLEGWRLWAWRYFMKYVFPNVERGWLDHSKLIEQGHIVHATGVTPDHQ